MNKYDWKNAFPKPSENFHNKLCMTLDSFEKENVKMKKVSFKKSIIIAAAVLAIGTAAFASRGAVSYVVGSTSTKPDYTTIPVTETLNKNVGFSPKIVEQFSNGYTFKGGHNGKNKYVDEENGTADAKSIARAIRKVHDAEPNLFKPAGDDGDDGNGAGGSGNGFRGKGPGGAGSTKNGELEAKKAEALEMLGIKKDDKK